MPGNELIFPETVIYLELPPSSHGHCVLVCWELERAWWPPVAAFKTVQKQLLPVDWQSQKPRQGAALANPSVNKHMKQATLLWPMVFKQLVTAAHALVTKFKHCESDWLLHKLLTPMLWAVAMVPLMLVITSVHADARLIYFHQLLLQFLCPRITCGWFCRRSTWLLAAFLNQTWVKCTSLDSSRCVVYSGIRFRMIRAAI